MIKVHQHALINQKKKKKYLRPVCRWPLGRYFKKEKTYLTNKKKCSKRFSKLTFIKKKKKILSLCHYIQN